MAGPSRVPKLCSWCARAPTSDFSRPRRGADHSSFPLFKYFFLNLFYTPFTIYKYGFRAWGKMLWTDGYKYLFLAAVDVEVRGAAGLDSTRQN